MNNSLRVFHSLLQDTTVHPGNARLKVVQVMIERLKVTGEQIKQLEVKKKAAVESEDYDAAKVCKVYSFSFLILFY